MQLVIAQLVGVMVFFVGVLILGLWLRRRPTAGAARRMSVASHTLFHAGLSVPMVWGLFWPGAGRFDAIVGLPSLPVPIAWRFLGVVLLAVGIYFVALSNVALAKWGKGWRRSCYRNRLSKPAFMSGRATPWHWGGI